MSALLIPEVGTRQRNFEGVSQFLEHYYVWTAMSLTLFVPRLTVPLGGTLLLWCGVLLELLVSGKFYEQAAAVTRRVFTTLQNVGSVQGRTEMRD